MELKAKTKAALDAWLEPSTWDSGNYEDMWRFYKFVSQYAREHGCVIYESDLLEKIKSLAKAKGHSTGDAQEKLILDFISLAYKILGFLAATES